MDLPAYFRHLEWAGKGSPGHFPSQTTIQRWSIRLLLDVRSERGGLCRPQVKEPLEKPGRFTWWPLNGNGNVWRQGTVVWARGDGNLTPLSRI